MSTTRHAALGDGLTAGTDAAGSIAAPDDSLVVPTTPLADKASDLIARELPAHLRNHSVRGYLFGRAVAAQQGLRPGTDYDDETMYLICALHDIGLADIANGMQRFEIDGADYAARFLEDNGATNPLIDTVWDAIAAHTSGFSDSPVYRRRRPPEIWIAVEGIGIDVAAGPQDLPPDYADRVHAAYPRFGGTRALLAAIEMQALADPRKAPPGTLTGEIVRQRHPDAPYPTWDMILESSIWND
ncbi:HD domain-containing protein [Nocardia sp. NPDC023852]|uniref:HD domain-containing protein n=1 Tax=Nocardia sp. NPDC023852 TaxID=3154697 RepID=UPI0033D94553